MTAVYFVVLTAGLGEVVADPASRVAFATGVLLASLGWQLTLAGAASLAGARLPSWLRAATSVAGSPARRGVCRPARPRVSEPARRHRRRAPPAPRPGGGAGAAPRPSRRRGRRSPPPPRSRSGAPPPRRSCPRGSRRGRRSLPRPGRRPRSRTGTCRYGMRLTPARPGMTARRNAVHRPRKTANAPRSRRNIRARSSRSSCRRSGRSRNTRWPHSRPTSYPRVSPMIAQSTTSTMSTRRSTPCREAMTPPSTTAVSPGSTNPRRPPPRRTRAGRRARRRAAAAPTAGRAARRPSPLLLSAPTHPPRNRCPRPVTGCPRVGGRRRRTPRRRLRGARRTARARLRGGRGRSAAARRGPGRVRPVEVGLGRRRPGTGRRHRVPDRLHDEELHRGRDPAPARRGQARAGRRGGAVRPRAGRRPVAHRRRSPGDAAEPADDDGRFPHRRPVGRPAAGAARRRLRRADRRRPQPWPGLPERPTSTPTWATPCSAGWSPPWPAARTPSSSPAGCSSPAA